MTVAIIIVGGISVFIAVFALIHCGARGFEMLLFVTVPAILVLGLFNAATSAWQMVAACALAVVGISGAAWGNADQCHSLRQFVGGLASAAAICGVTLLSLGSFS